MAYDNCPTPMLCNGERTCMESGLCTKDLEHAAARRAALEPLLNRQQWPRASKAPAPVVLLDKTYHGFEDAVDIERDVFEMFEGKGIPGEFQGTIKVLVTYVEADPT